MEKTKFKILDGWENTHVKLLLIVFGAALIAKGGVLARGFAVDDYAFGQGFTKGELSVFLTQGRFLLGGIDSFIDSLGVNINDLYISLGVCALLLQAALVVSILRFVGVANARGAALVGAVMVVHPYLAEILTFRMVLPGYCVAAAFSIVSLEMILRGPLRWPNIVISLGATVGMLFIYQGFLNYFSVAIIFTYLFGAISWKRIGFDVADGQDLKRRAAALMLVCLASAFIFLVILSASKSLGWIELTGRANLIERGFLVERIGQIKDLLLQIYWLGEPVSPRWLKVFVAAMISIAVILTARIFWSQERDSKKFFDSLGIALSLLLLIPVTVGVIAPFKDWHPVPRVLPQVALIVGLLLLVGYSVVRGFFGKIPGSIFSGFLTLLLVSFVLISNQIFADQKRVNSWDRAEANRVIARLEQEEKFSRVEYVFVSSGSWHRSSRLNTIQGDMNISAFSPEYSRVPLLVEVSGYAFKKSSADQNMIGEKFCEKSKPWPDRGSISIVENLAIVCLKK
ncbi:glucosyltransferase domain-containing protein [Variovorax boronicumulans]|uniref:glucosyltransferase domain-containing protein n=1 Tax=Variovorax boronicumulans TaxID=436515 RepID=UPI0012E55289|nr:glucosyltransferase domain-containing protein [Variovorax boronicumulans]GER13295.1 hypothetical protein VHAB30_44790 [Variovorax boronicumulans]